MEPRIGRSIGQGFLAANRSWAGIGLYVAGLTGLTLLVVLGVMLTNPPPEVFQERPGIGARLEEPLAFAQEAETPEAEEPDLFNQLETAGDQETTATETAPPAAPAVETPAAAPAQTEEQARAVGAWFGRAWPVLLLCLLIAVAGNAWLSAGQIGYVAKRVTTPPVAVSEFWKSGTRAFLPVLGGGLLSLVGLAGLVGLLFLFSALLAVLPTTARAVLGVLLGLALLVSLIWVVVRLAFWFIVIVADRQGPLAALKTSFRASRGRWWRLAGLGLLMALISYAVWLPFAFLEWVGTVVGGGAAVALGLLSNVGGFVVSLYVGFAALGAYVRFYEDTK